MSFARTIATSLALGLLTTSTLTTSTLASAATADPSSVEHAVEEPAEDPATVVVEEPGPGLPALTPADAEAIRLHTARVLAATSAASGLAAGTSRAPASVHPVVTRHAGGDRYATAARLAGTMWRDGIWADVDGVPFPYDKVVFVASGSDYPDGLSGGALAAHYGGPLLLTRTDSLPGPTASVLADLDPDYVVLLGGQGAVHDSVAVQLEQYVPYPERVVRYGGGDRYEVSANIARTIFGHGFGQRAYVALGTDWPDGLAGAAAAGWERAPLLLTRSSGVPGVVMQTLRQYQPEEIVLLGGSGVVSEDILLQLQSVAPVVRVDGADRYVVAANVADLHPTRYGATVASGQDWPDALAGSAYAGLVGGKLLLVRPTGVPGATRQTVIDQSLALIDALGGPGPLPGPVLDQLRALTVATPG